MIITVPLVEKDIKLIVEALQFTINNKDDLPYKELQDLSWIKEYLRVSIKEEE